MFFVQIAGRLGKDPETRFTPSGQKVTTFNVAINQRKGKEEVTTWVRVTLWGERFDKMVTYLKKGSGVIVSGRMNPPASYTDKEGRTQIALEITAEMMEFNPFFNKDEKSGENQGSQNYASTQHDYSSQGSQAHEEPYQGNSSYANSKSNAYGSNTLTGQGAQNDYGDEKLPF